MSVAQLRGNLTLLNTKKPGNSINIAGLFIIYNFTLLLSTPKLKSAL